MFAVVRVFFVRWCVNAVASPVLGLHMNSLGQVPKDSKVSRGSLFQRAASPGPGLAPGLAGLKTCMSNIYSHTDMFDRTGGYLRR